MALRLRVISEHRHRMGDKSSFVFGVSGGSIGRSAENDWMLPDDMRYVSGRHARIVFHKGRYLLQDTSSNGTFVNDIDKPLGGQNPHELKSGDILRIDVNHGSPYAISKLLGEMLGDVRRAVWGELSSGPVHVDPFRRLLQRSWLAQADSKINPSPAMIIMTPSPPRPRARSSSGPNNDVRALMRGELLSLDASVQSALSRASDRTTRLHLLDVREEIKRILDPES